MVLKLLPCEGSLPGLLSYKLSIHISKHEWLEWHSDSVSGSRSAVQPPKVGGYSLYLLS